MSMTIGVLVVLNQFCHHIPTIGSPYTIHINSEFSTTNRVHLGTFGNHIPSYCTILFATYQPFTSCPVMPSGPQSPGAPLSGGRAPRLAALRGDPVALRLAGRGPRRAPRQGAARTGDRGRPPKTYRNAGKRWENIRKTKGKPWFFFN